MGTMARVHRKTAMLRGENENTLFKSRNRGARLKAALQQRVSFWLMASWGNLRALPWLAGSGPAWSRTLHSQPLVPTLFMRV